MLYNRRHVPTVGAPRWGEKGQQLREPLSDAGRIVGVTGTYSGRNYERVI